MNLRKKILTASLKAKACHISSALSCVEIIKSIYEAKKPEDMFLFAKASGVSALYCYKYSLEKATELLKKYPLPSQEAGLPWTGGSLGQGLSVACGVALTGKKVYVLMSDGELQEGQVWEALMFGAHHKLPIVAIIDRNKLQALGGTEKINALEPLEEKFRAFGWNTQVVDGHNIEELKEAMKCRTPIVIIAETIKGRGVDFMENKYEWHYKNLTEERYQEAICQLPD